jgi:hypothetical protein
MDYNNQANADLRSRLVENFVNPQVIAPMEQAGWNNDRFSRQQMSGQPAVDDGANTPAPAQMDDPSAPASAPLYFEQFKEANGLYAGKYKTPEELVRGMSNVVSMAKQAFTERDELRERLNARQVTDPSPSREGASFPEPVQVEPTGGLDAALRRIIEDGGVLDEGNSQLLRDAVIELTQQTARNVTSAKEATTQKWDEVSRKMDNLYPGSSNRADELTLYVQSNPHVATAVSALLAEGKEFEATEMAWRLMTMESPTPPSQPTLTDDMVRETKLQAQDSVRQEAVDAARRDAGVLTTAGSGVHEAPPPATTRDEITAAAAIGHKTADYSMWRRAALGQYLDFDSPLFR